ncbi:MAG: hypothetical protein QJR04_25145 [Burkholderia multivorans]|nr:hypothetical protein [Burkholderia multivorans]
MELNLTLALFNGQAQVHARCNSFDELKLVKSFLVEQGLLTNPAAAANTAIGAQTAAAPVAQQTAGDVGNQQQAAQEPAGNEQKATRTRAKKDAAATATDQGGSTQSQTSAPASAGSNGAAPTIQDVTAAITDVANKWDVSEAMALNKRFGVKKAGELKPEQFAEYIAFARDCLANNRKPTEAQLPEGAAADDVSSLV